MFEYVEDFPANFILSEHDPASQRLPDLVIATEDASMLAPTFEIDVETAAGNQWTGRVFGGRDGLNQIASHPNPSKLICIAGGIAYSIATEEPDRYEVLPLRPVLGTSAALDAKIRLLIGFTSIVAIGIGGIVWKTPRLVADGFFEVRSAKDCVVVRGHEAGGGQDVELTLELTSGKIIDRR